MGLKPKDNQVNRETQALLWHLAKNPGLYDEFTELVAYPAERWDGKEESLIQGRAEMYLVPAEYEAEYGESQPEDYARIAADVGDLTHVNWSQVRAALTDD